jgi:hypothetical protein
LSQKEMIVHTETAEEIRVISMREADDERDEYPYVTQADVDRATFRIGLKAAPRKQRVTILLDTELIEYFNRLGPQYRGARAGITCRTRMEHPAGMDMCPQSTSPESR